MTHLWDERTTSDHRADASAAADTPPQQVAEVMTPQPTCVRPTDSVLELVRVFHDKRFRHLLVADGGRLIGVVSDRDVGRCFGTTAYPDEMRLAKITAAQIMSTDVVTIEASASITLALDLMYEQGVSCLPVVVDGRLVGIITTSDMLRLLRRLVDVGVA